MARVHRPNSISRRVVVGLPATLLLHQACRGAALAQAQGVSRETIAATKREAGFLPPLTLGMARVVLRPGASAWAATPGGVRLLVVEAGVLGVTVESGSRGGMSAFVLASAPVPPDPDDELLLPAGTAATFASGGVTSVRNPGARPVVVLDAAVFHEEPRPLQRAFTTEGGVSVQLLASASAAGVPVGKAAVTLERLRLERASALPSELSVGLMLIYVEVGSINLFSRQGDVSMARAAAAAPYAMPGALQAIANGERRGVTAGGVIFLPAAAEAGIGNEGRRTAEMLVLSIRETD